MRLLHFSDLHLGVEIHGKRDPETGMHTQLKDFLRCMDFMVETATQRDIDVVLFTGDAYHSRRPDPLSQREFIKRIIALSERNIRVLLLAGNHDLPPGYGEASALDIFNVVKVPGVIFVRKPEVVQLVTRKGELQVVCLPYLPRRALVSFEEERGLDEEGVQRLMGKRVQEWIESLLRKIISSDIPTVFAGHLWVKGAEFSGSEHVLSSTSEPVVPPSFLRHQSFTLVALGHIHRYQALDDNKPHIIYAGSLGRIDFGEEAQPKGFVFVELEKTQQGKWEANWEFIPTPTRPFVTVKLDVRNSNNPTQTALEELSKNLKVNGAVVRVQVLVKEAQKDIVNLVKLRELLENRADHIAAIELQPEDSLKPDEIVVARSPEEFERMLKRSPIEWLESWIDELAKKDKTIADRKKRLLELARNLMET